MRKRGEYLMEKRFIADFGWVWKSTITFFTLLITWIVISNNRKFIQFVGVSFSLRKFIIKDIFYRNGSINLSRFSFWNKINCKSFSNNALNWFLKICKAKIVASKFNRKSQKHADKAKMLTMTFAWVK